MNFSDFKLSADLLILCPTHNLKVASSYPAPVAINRFPRTFNGPARTEEQLEAGTFGTLRPTHVTLGELLERYSGEVTPAKRGATTELRRLQRLIRDPVSSLRVSQLTSKRPSLPSGTVGSSMDGAPVITTSP